MPISTTKNHPGKFQEIQNISNVEYASLCDICGKTALTDCGHNRDMLIIPD